MSVPVDPQSLLDSIPNLDPSVKAAALAALNKNTSNDPLAFTGNWSGQLTGYPGAYTNQQYVLTGAPGAKGGQTKVYLDGGRTGGQEDTRAPIFDTSSNMIFKFQEALLSGVAWAQATKADMVAAGLIEPNAAPNLVIAAYAQMVSLSAGAKDKGVNKSPQDYIDQWKVLAQHDANTPVTTTQTSTSRTVRNPADLAAAYQQTSEQALGRRATAAEAKAGGAAGGAVATPTVSTTTTTTTGRHSSSSTVTHEGASEQAINEAMLQHAFQNPEYGAYQAASTYFNALQQALGAVSGVGQ